MTTSRHALICQALEQARAIASHAPSLADDTAQLAMALVKTLEDALAAEDRDGGTAALFPAWWTLRHGQHELVGLPGWAGPSIEPNVVDGRAGYRVRCNGEWTDCGSLTAAARWISAKLGCEVKAP